MNAPTRKCFVNVFVSKGRATNAHATCPHMVRQEQVFGTFKAICRKCKKGHRGDLIT